MEITKELRAEIGARIDARLLAKAEEQVKIQTKKYAKTIRRMNRLSDRIKALKVKYEVIAAPFEAYGDNFERRKLVALGVVPSFSLSNSEHLEFYAQRTGNMIEEATRKVLLKLQYDKSVDLEEIFKEIDKL